MDGIKRKGRQDRDGIHERTDLSMLTRHKKPWVKHPGRSLAATSAAGPLLSRLLYVQDRNSGTQFLFDTGSCQVRGMF